jgi:hypothetical protein
MLLWCRRKKNVILKSVYNTGTFNNVKTNYPWTGIKWGGDRLGEGNNFDQKNNCLFWRLFCVPFGQIKLFLPIRYKNLMTDTDDIIANKK